MSSQPSSGSAGAGHSSAESESEESTVHFHVRPPVSSAISTPSSSTSLPESSASPSSGV